MEFVRNTFLWSLIITFGLLQLAYAPRPFISDFDTLNVDVNKKFVKFCNFTLIPYNNHQAINGNIFFRKDIYNISVVHWVTSFKSDGRLWVLYNITMNGCQLLEDKFNNLNVITKAVVQGIKQKMPALPNGCPFKKDVNHALSHFYLDEEMLPVFVPNIKFETAFNLLSNNEYFFKLRLTAHIESITGKGNKTRKRP
ncbi:uncharacterized protein [Musca autumnalis]|uniref:uncharacterized protein n=1 Tax=Musca autumnalis TaxID=221902 RepID=UPI003CEDAC50